MSYRYKNGRRVLLDRMNLTPEDITVVDKSIQRIGDKAMVDINSQVAVTENSSGNPSKRASSEPPSSTLLLLSNLQKGLKGVTDHELKDLFEDVGKQRFVMLYRVMTSNRSISFDDIWSSLDSSDYTTMLKAGPPVRLTKLRGPCRNTKASL